MNWHDSRYSPAEIKDGIPLRPWLGANMLCGSFFYMFLLMFAKVLGYNSRRVSIQKFLFRKQLSLNVRETEHTKIILLLSIYFITESLEYPITCLYYTGTPLLLLQEAVPRPDAYADVGSRARVLINTVNHCCQIMLPCTPCSHV